MELFFSPLAGSMATRIVLAETGKDATFVEVDPFTKRTVPEGRDYHDIHSLGLVPALRTDQGDVLTENLAVLWHIADGSSLAPEEHAGRLRQWLGFIGTELHKTVFSCLFDPAAPEGARTYAIEKSKARLAYLDGHMNNRRFLLDSFTVADAYLLTVLNWAQATPVDLEPWPSVRAYLARGLQRPSVKAAVAHELPRFLAERERAKAAKG